MVSSPSFFLSHDPSPFVGSKDLSILLRSRYVPPKIEAAQRTRSDKISKAQKDIVTKAKSATTVTSETHGRHNPN